MTKCPDCPASGDCVVQKTGHAPYCDWAKAGGAWRERVVAMSAAEPVRIDRQPGPPGNVAVHYEVVTTQPGCCG